MQEGASCFISLIFREWNFWSFPVMHIISVKIIGIYLKAESAEFWEKLNATESSFWQKILIITYDN